MLGVGEECVQERGQHSHAHAGEGQHRVSTTHTHAWVGCAGDNRGQHKARMQSRPLCKHQSSAQVALVIDNLDPAGAHTIACWACKTPTAAVNPSWPSARAHKQSSSSPAGSAHQPT